MADNTTQITTGMTVRQAVKLAKKNGASKDAIKTLKQVLKMDGNKTINNPIEAQVANSIMTGNKTIVSPIVQTANYIVTDNDVKNYQTMNGQDRIISNTTYTYQKRNQDGTFTSTNVNFWGNISGNCKMYFDEKTGKCYQLADLNADSNADVYRVWTRNANDTQSFDIKF